MKCAPVSARRSTATVAALLAAAALEVGSGAASELSLDRGRAVYALGRRIELLDVKSGRASTAAVATSAPVGPIVIGSHVFWGARVHSGSRLR
jgi:hypothetical protein